MKSILIALDESLYYLDLPKHLRGMSYQMADRMPASVEMNEVTSPIYVRRTFQWRGRIARRDGSDLFDFFEEVEG